MGVAPLLTPGTASGTALSEGGDKSYRRAVLGTMTGGEADPLRLGVKERVGDATRETTDGVPDGVPHNLAPPPTPGRAALRRNGCSISPNSANPGGSCCASCRREARASLT